MMHPGFIRADLRRLRHARRGSLLVEFTLSALALIVLMMVTVEFGLEIFRRQSAERAAGAAALIYAETGSLEAAQIAAESKMVRAFQGCIEPLDVRLFDGFAQMQADIGRAADDTAADAGARIARVDFSCNWSRLTPPARAILGADGLHRSVSYVRMRP